MNYNAVIFDLFGTLIDDFTSSVGQMHKEMAAVLDVPYEQFNPRWIQTTEMRITGVFATVEASIEYVLGEMHAPARAEQIKKAVEIRMRSIEKALRPRPHAIETLHELKSRRYKIGLLSNCSIEIPILWPETPFADLIDSAVFSSRERLKKPDPSIYQLACERLGVAPERCLYIADGENYELTAAGKVGLHLVLIRNSAQDNGTELLREAREWQGDSIGSLTEVLLRVRD